MPAVVMVRLAAVPTTLVPSLQEYVDPPLAVTLMEVVVQFSSLTPVLLVMDAVGTLLSLVIVMEASAVQPLAAVAVTV